MNKKIIITLVVVAGLVIGYKYFSNKKAIPKKDYSNTKLATEKDGLDLYNKLSSEGQWGYSTEGIKMFTKIYSQQVTKGKHNQMMDILSSSREKRSANQSQMIDDVFNNIVLNMQKTSIGL